MTLVSDVIRRAYRETNLIPQAAAAPSTAQTNEALDLFNGILLATIGSEAGRELSDLNIGGEYDQSSLCSEWVPENARLVLNLGAATTLQLSPQPYEGQRVAVADAGANLATRNLILDGNGRTIETTATVTLSTNSLARQWLYRGDTANWVRITSLVAADTMPLPVEFDDYFVIRLAARLNPRYGQALAAETVNALNRWEQQIGARYRKPRPPQDSGTLGLMGQRRGLVANSSVFSAGWPFL